MNVLERIVEQTKEDLAKRRRNRSLTSLREEALYHERGQFSLKEALSSTRKALNIIAEVKKASPSKGVIREDFKPLDHALDYQEHGASAISCLTDEPFFQGHLSYMKAIAERIEIPLLRKDFIVDPYQVIEAKAYGANAILLITSICSRQQLAELHHAADEEGLECLVELYAADEIEKLDLQSMSIIGVNNRDLKTFKVDLHRGVEILQSLPAETIKVSESGLSDTKDLKFLVESGIHAALIGESFMRQPQPGKALKAMIQPLEEQINPS